MYHPGHPDGDYRMFNKVQVLDPPRAIGWLPRTDPRATVTWSAVRRHLAGNHYRMDTRNSR